MHVGFQPEIRRCPNQSGLDSASPPTHTRTHTRDSDHKSVTLELAHILVSPRILLHIEILCTKVCCCLLSWFVDMLATCVSSHPRSVWLSSARPYAFIICPCSTSRCLKRTNCGYFSNFTPAAHFAPYTPLVFSKSLLTE